MRCSLCFLLLFFVAACRSGSDEQVIRELRKQTNRAFKENNIQKFTSFFTGDIAITTGNGTGIRGKDSLTRYLTVAFGKNPGIYFVRETTNVKISASGNRAWETGSWEGYNPGDKGWKRPRGNYSAMWIRTDDHWKIHSELFVQLY